LRPSAKESPARVTRMSYMAGDGTAGPAPLATYIQVKTGVDCVNGGYMLLGREGFTETPCETPKVEYNFDELCDALDYILGGDPNNFLGQGIKYKHNLRDFKRSSTYTASYTGNLREVLSAWAADFSFDFSFDYTKADLWIQGLSLEDPINLKEIKEAIELGFGADSEGGLIRNMTEKITLENTYKQAPLVKYIKPPRPFIRNQKHYEQAVGKILKLEDAVGKRANLGRTWDELYISIALAKFQPEARILWLSDQARKKWLEPNWENPDVYPTAGNVNPHFAPGLSGQANFPNGCKECPNWDKQLNVSGSKKWASEYECIKNGEGTGKVIPNNPSMPKEEWFQYNAGLNRWGKVKRFNSKVMYHHPDCLPGGATPGAGNGDDESHFADYYCKPLANVNLAVENISQRPGWQSPSWRIDIPWMALGFFPERRITSGKKRHDLLLAHKEAMQGKIKKPFKHPIWKVPENYDCFIGVWNKNFQNKVLEYDKDVADNFFGKYAWWYGNRTDEGELAVGIPPNYGPINPPPSEQQCPKWLFDYEAESKHRTYMYRYDVKTSPESQVYSGNSYPFIEVLKVNDYIFGDDGKAINGDDTDPCTYCPERAIFEIEDNTWGTPQEVIDDLFHNRYIVDSTHSSPGFNPEAIVSMADIGEYVPIYTVLRQDRQIRDLYKRIGIRYFDESVYKPEHAESGYFPGVAFIPRMEKCVGDDGNPILKIGYEHWYCEATTTTPAPPVGTTAPPRIGAARHTPQHTAFCETGCPPCTCGDILDAISNPQKTCDPPDCIEPCWECVKADGKKYGNIRSSGTPNPPPNDPATGLPWVSDPANPTYEPFNPAWQTCLAMACEEDYGLCEKDKKTIGYPTARTIDGKPYSAMDPTSCGTAGGTWIGADDVAECAAIEQLDIKVSINSDPNACACWECSINEVGGGVYYFGDETKAKEFCGQNSTMAQKDKITVTAGDPVGGSIEVTFSLAGGPVVVTTQSFANDDDSTAVQLATDIMGSGITGISATASGNIVSVQTPAPTLTAKTVAVGTAPSTANASSTFGEAIDAVRVHSSASGGKCGVGPEGPCPADVYLAGSEIVNAKVYDNTRRRVMEWHQENATPKDCRLWCEEDIVKTVCGCDPPDEPIHKFSNYRARYFNITHRTRTKKIIFPIEHDYVGYWHSDATEKGYYPRKHIVLGTPPDLANLQNPMDANVMETRIVDVDVTQDLDSIEMGDNNSPGSYHEQLVVNNPYKEDADGNPVPEVVDLPTYYTFLRSVNKSADSANRTLNLKVDGTEFDTLKDLLKPAHGLSNFSVSVGSDGISTDITYVSRPAKLPKRDILMQKIGPRAIEGRIPKPAVDTILNDWNIG
jgi:hypothetical protein